MSSCEGSFASVEAREGGVDQRHREQHGDAERDDEPDLPLALGVHERRDYRKPAGRPVRHLRESQWRHGRPSPADHRRQQRHRRRDRPRRRRQATAWCWRRGGEEELEALAEELGGDERALAVRCDVTEWDQVEAMAAAALERFGRIDAVFANAGFGATRGFLEESVEHWRSMVLTNVYGAALTIRATLPHLLERGDGHFLDHQLGRRPPGAAGLALLGDQVGGDGDRRVAAGASCARCTTTRRSR